jgi:hypothetical protein
MSALGRENELRAPIVRIRYAADVAVGLQVLDELRHCLLGHLGTLSEKAHCRSGVIQILENHAVRGPYQTMALLCQSGNNKIVQRYERLSHENSKVGGSLFAAELRNAS